MSLSSQHHSFDISLAAEYGIEEAILIHHFQHWIRVNKSRGRNHIDGKTWTYQSRKDIEAHFPYLNEEKIRYACEKLVKEGILLTANYNKNKIDKTLWYAFVDEEKFIPEISKNVYERENSQSTGKKAIRGGKIPTPIPDTKDRYLNTDPPPTASANEKDLLKQKCLKEGISEKDFEKAYERLKEQPLGSIKVAWKWIQAVAKNFEKEKDQESLVQKRKRYAEQFMNFYSQAGCSCVTEKGVEKVSGSCVTFCSFEDMSGFWDDADRWDEK